MKDDNPLMDRDWMEHAACRDYPTEWWFPENHSRPPTLKQAKMICMRCPVRQDCEDYANTNEIAIGMWGGKMPFARGYKDARSKRVVPS